MKAMNVLSIGKLSQQSGVNIETIRYYEKIGVMPAPGRSAGGFRVYEPDHLKRLSFVRRSRQLGFSLDEIRNLLRLVDGHGHTCAEVHALMLSHLAEIRRKIRDLRRLQRAMAEMAARWANTLKAKCTSKFVPLPGVSPGCVIDHQAALNGGARLGDKRQVIGCFRPV
jgi:MerR family transcriptional regulator, mercuric resistance operon regulatory protein